MYLANANTLVVRVFQNVYVCPVVSVCNKDPYYMYIIMMLCRNKLCQIVCSIYRMYRYLPSGHNYGYILDIMGILGVLGVLDILGIKGIMGKLGISGT